MFDHPFVLDQLLYPAKEILKKPCEVIPHTVLLILYYRV